MGVESLGQLACDARRWVSFIYVPGVSFTLEGNEWSWHRSRGAQTGSARGGGLLPRGGQGLTFTLQGPEARSGTQ